MRQTLDIIAYKTFQDNPCEVFTVGAEIHKISPAFICQGFSFLGLFHRVILNASGQSAATNKFWFSAGHENELISHKENIKSACNDFTVSTSDLKDSLLSYPIFCR